MKYIHTNSCKLQYGLPISCFRWLPKDGGESVFIYNDSNNKGSLYLEIRGADEVLLTLTCSGSHKGVIKREGVFKYILRSQSHLLALLKTTSTVEPHNALQWRKVWSLKICFPLFCSSQLRGPTVIITVTV